MTAAPSTALLPLGPPPGETFVTIGGVALRIRHRALAVVVLLLAAGVASTIAHLVLGELRLPVADVVAALFGEGSREAELVAQQFRLPRAVTGLLVGASRGAAGAIFQSSARNPLASPDIIGVNAGAGVAAVVAIVLVDGARPWHVSTAAFLGGLVAAGLVYVLALRGGLSGYRLVLVGIGITAILGSFNPWLLRVADIEDARRATIWLTGSLNGRGWGEVAAVAITFGIGVLLLIPLTRAQQALELGDDLATALGSPVQRARLGLVLVGVGLAAGAVAVAGPVEFVALMSPQVARRLTRTPGVGVVGSAAVGAVLVSVTDLFARQAFAPVELPVGIITGAIGAPYLLFLLAIAKRQGRG